MHDAEEITLHIAANLGRLARWAIERRTARVDQFLKETEEYLLRLREAPHGKRFAPTLERFEKEFNALKEEPRDLDWAERALTWANILTHRAKLVS